MNNRDRETWERFAAAIVAGVCANPAIPKIYFDGVRDEADRLLALTKQRWPDELSGNPPELPEKTCSPRCECVTQPAAGDETVTWEPDPGEIGAESPEPVMYSIVWDGDETPDAECCYRTYALAHRCLADAGGKGTVVPLYAVPVDAAREIAAARREAEEAKKECERQRASRIALADALLIANAHGGLYENARQIVKNALREHGGAA
jgi:hypothetical protein